MKKSIVILLVSCSSMFGADYYVDQVGGSNGNTGLSDAQAWATIQYALDNITKGTDGDQINIKAGAPTTLTGTLDFTTYVAPTGSQPLVFRGYTTTANDGGKGTIEGDGAISILNNVNEVSFIDMIVDGNGCGDDVLYLGNYCSVINCEVKGGGSANFQSAIRTGSGCRVIGCRITDNYNGIGVSGASCYIANNYISNEGTVDFTYGISLSSSYADVANNIINVSGASNGIRLYTLCNVAGNSIYGSTSTGDGLIGGTYSRMNVSDNLIEGFAKAYEASGTDEFYIFANNSEDGNTTGFDSRHFTLYDDGNENTGSSPFAKSGANDYANRNVYFAPLDVGSVWGGRLGNPTRDRGAVQHAEAGGAPTSTIYNQTRP